MKKPININIDYQGEDIGETFFIYKIEEDEYQKTITLRNSEKHYNKYTMKEGKSFEQLLNEYKQKVKEAINKVCIFKEDINDLYEELEFEE